MQWIHRFQLFLFDFDGLLVNSEPLHYQAYMNALRKRGVEINWGFARFCKLAHLNDRALREEICAYAPSLAEDWPSFYADKRRAYEEILAAGQVELMPGVEPLLQALAKADIRRAVATNSPRAQTDVVKQRIPLLQSIPLWVTREDYVKSKPDPECYLQAIQKVGKQGDRIIGFEDSVRGLEALRRTPALPILICPADHPLLEIALANKGNHFTSFGEIPSDF